MRTMRAAAIDRFGGPAVLKIHTLPIPKPSAQEVLIEIDTAGVGIWDVKARSGKWAEREEFPLILGTDGSGVVAEVGSQVRRLKVGDRVYAYSYDNPKGGFYAEFAAVAASKVARLPEGLDLLPAGAIPTIALTALQGVDDTLEINEGENVVIHGASGKDGIAFVRRLGADEAIDGKKDDVVWRDVDAVLAFAGGKELTRCLDALKKGGRAAYPNGIEPEPRKRKGIKIKSYDGSPGVREFERLNRAIDSMDIQVPIAAGFKLEDAADAHRFMEKGHILGKVVLRVSS